METNKTQPLLNGKLSLFTVGLLNVIFFHWAIVQLFFFLYQDGNELEAQSLFSPILSFLINLILITVFTIPHSLMLELKWKKKIAKIFPGKIFFTVYSLYSSLSLLLLMNYWQPFGGTLYQTSGYLKHIIQALYGGSWLFMGWSLLATGFLKQNGIIHWLKAMQGKTVSYRIPYSGPYKYMRHPIYFSFLGMIWFSPSMTVDHFLLTAIWTFYLFFGAALKENRLLKNPIYKKYTYTVSPYPLMPKKPLEEIFKSRRFYALYR